MTSQSYKVNFISSYFISITIDIDSYAGGGGNGSSHARIALTFDLVNRKIITTSDIFNKPSFPSVYNIFKEQFNSLQNDEINCYEKFNRSDSLFWVQNSPFALYTDKIILYTAVSYGHGYYDGEIIYEFEKFPDIFDKKFLSIIMKK